MNPKEVYYEPKLTQFLYNKASYLKKPLGGTFELSPVCNLACKMCYVRKTNKQVQESTRGLFSIEDWLNIAKQAYDAGMLYLLLTGGEPLLYDGFKELFEELDKMGFVLTINSNGILINDEWIDFFKKHTATRMNITLYGACNETYLKLCGDPHGFDKVKKSILSLKENKIPVKLNCSLTPYNANDLEKMIVFAEENELIIEVNTYMFPPIRRDSSMIGQNDRFTPYEAAFYQLKRYRLQYGEEQYRVYLNAIINDIVEPMGLDECGIDLKDGKVRCRAGKSAFWITWDGFMTPCGMVPEPKIDLYQNDFHEAWKQIVTLTDNLQLSGVCQECKNNQMCHSCVAMAYAETGNSEGIPQYLCEMMKEIKSIANDQLKQLNKDNV